MTIDPRRIEVIDDATAAMFRRMTPAERWSAADAMHRQCVQMVTSVVRASHPEWDSNQVAAEVSRRLSRGAA